VYVDIIIAVFLLGFPEYYNDPLSGVGNSTLLLNRPSAVFHNPALMGRSAEISLNYARPYNLQGVHQAQVSFQVKGFGFGAQTLRTDGYSESRLMIGKELSGKNFRTGISFGVSDVTAGPERAAALSINLGFAFESFGGKVVNAFHVTGIRVKGTEDLLSPAMSLSFKYRGSEDIDLYLDFYQEARFPLGLRSGCSVRIGDLRLLFGLSSAPDCYALAISLETSPLFLYRLRIHPYLGATHGFGVNIGM